MKEYFQPALEAHFAASILVIHCIGWDRDEEEIWVRSQNWYYVTIKAVSDVY